jgi:SAF domain
MSNPEPAALLPAPPQAAERLGTSPWRAGRLALGTLLVLVAVLGGALVLQRAQRLQPVYVAARDLPSGTVLDPADLTVARVNLPDAELRHYLQPTGSVTGRVLTIPVPKDALVPAANVAASAPAGDMVELPISAERGDVARGLRPGDRVQVIAAYSDGPRRGQAVVLLPSAEITELLQEAGGISGTDRQTGVQVRMPKDSAPLVTAAIASARIFVVKAPPGTASGATPAPTPGATPAPTPGATPAPTLGTPREVPAPSAGTTYSGQPTGTAATTPEGTGPPTTPG